jgi:hypothetical protein
MLAIFILRAAADFENCKPASPIALKNIVKLAS